MPQTCRGRYMVFIFGYHESRDCGLRDIHAPRCSGIHEVADHQAGGFVTANVDDGSGTRIGRSSCRSCHEPDNLDDAGCVLQWKPLSPPYSLELAALVDTIASDQTSVPNAEQICTAGACHVNVQKNRKTGTCLERKTTNELASRGLY